MLPVSVHHNNKFPICFFQRMQRAYAKPMLRFFTPVQKKNPIAFKRPNFPPCAIRRPIISNNDNTFLIQKKLPYYSSYARPLIQNRQNYAVHKKSAFNSRVIVHYPEHFRRNGRNQYSHNRTRKARGCPHVRPCPCFSAHHLPNRINHGCKKHHEHCGNRHKVVYSHAKVVQRSRKRACLRKRNPYKKNTQQIRKPRRKNKLPYLHVFAPLHQFWIKDYLNHCPCQTSTTTSAKPSST